MPVTNGMVWNPYWSGGGAQTPAQKARSSALNKFQIDWAEASKPGGASPEEQFNAVKKIGRINAAAAPDFRASKEYKNAQLGKYKSESGVGGGRDLDTVAKLATRIGPAGDEARKQMADWQDMADFDIERKTRNVIGRFAVMSPDYLAAERASEKTSDPERRAQLSKNNTDLYNAYMNTAFAAQKRAETFARPISGSFLDRYSQDGELQARVQETLDRNKSRKTLPIQYQAPAVNPKASDEKAKSEAAEIARIRSAGDRQVVPSSWSAVRAQSLITPGVGVQGATPSRWHEQVMEKYPQIGQRGSPENKAFVQAVEAQGTNTFEPMTLASDVMESVKKQKDIEYSQSAEGQFNERNKPPEPKPAPFFDIYK